MGLFLGKMFCRIADKNDTKRLSTQEVPQGVVTNTYEYVDDGNVFHKLNVYKAEGYEEDFRPVLIDIHGGGWYYGDKDLNRNYDKTFVLRGYTVISMSYRLIDKGVTFVEQLQDIFASFKWIEEHAEEQILDLENLFLTGDSAGAHLAGLALNCIGNPEMAKVFGVSTSLRFKAVNFTCGALIPTQLMKKPVIKSFMKPVVGKKIKKSPYYKYFDVTANLPSEYPPINLITCDGDFLRNMVFDAREIIDKSGLSYSLLYLDKFEAKGELPHVFNVLYPINGWGLAFNNCTDDFFKKHMCYI